MATNEKIGTSTIITIENLRVLCIAIHEVDMNMKCMDVNNITVAIIN